MSPRALWLAAAVAAIALAASAAAAPKRTVTVFAAASLQAPFEELAKRFEAAHPGTRVALNLAGSQQLSTQLRLGVRADVFASADTLAMNQAVRAGLVAGEPAVFAHNSLVVIVPRADRAHITRLQDLARSGVKLAFALEAVPIGHYSREALRRLSGMPGFAPDFAARVLANRVTEEENVKAVAAKVRMAEVDGGFVYRSDVNPTLAPHVRVLELPEAARIPASYPIAVLSEAPEASLAAAFIALVRSAEGQRVLVAHGLQPAANGAPPR